MEDGRRHACNGWLTKLGLKSGKWQRRYFVLSESSLAYYSDIGGKQKGFVPVSTFKSVHIVPTTENVDKTGCSVSLSKPIREFAFKVCAYQGKGLRSYYLIADTAREREIWMKHIHMCIDGPEQLRRSSMSQHSYPNTSRQSPTKQGMPEQQQQQQQQQQPQGEAPSTAPGTEFVPRSEACARLNILRQPWFRRSNSVREAQDYLENAEAGAFVVRDAPPSKLGSFDLMVQTGSGQVLRLLILKQSHEGKACWGLRGSGVAFEHILDLVLHYCQTGFTMKNHGDEILLNLSSCARAEAAHRQRRGTLSRPVVRPSAATALRNQRTRQTSQKTVTVDEQQKSADATNAPRKPVVEQQQSFGSTASALMPAPEKETQGMQPPPIGHAKVDDGEGEVHAGKNCEKTEPDSVSPSADTDKEPDATLSARKVDANADVDNEVGMAVTVPPPSKSVCLASNADLEALVSELSGDLSELSQRFSSKKQNLADIEVGVEISASSLDMRVMEAYKRIDAVRRKVERASSAANMNGDEDGNATSDVVDSDDDVAAAAVLTLAKESKARVDSLRNVIEAETAELSGLTRGIRTALEDMEAILTKFEIGLTQAKTLLDTRATDDATDDDAEARIPERIESIAASSRVLKDSFAQRTISMGEQLQQIRVLLSHDHDLMAPVLELDEAYGEFEAAHEEDDDASALVGEAADVFDAFAPEMIEEDALIHEERKVDPILEEPKVAEEVSQDQGPKGSEDSDHESEDESDADGDGVVDLVGEREESSEATEEVSSSQADAAAEELVSEKNVMDVDASAATVKKKSPPVIAKKPPSPTKKTQPPPAAPKPRSQTKAPPATDPKPHGSMRLESKEDASLDESTGDEPFGERRMTADQSMQVEKKRRERETAVEALQFMMDVLQQEIPGYESDTNCDVDAFADALKNGVLLCELMNVLSPLSVTHINKSKMAFHHMENIGNFLSAADGFGLRSNYSFQTVDLFEKQNLPQVMRAISHIKRLAIQRGVEVTPFHRD